MKKYIRPISLTQIAAKGFESLIVELFDGIVSDKIGDNQFGTSTTDALVELIHKWSEATDKLHNYVRVVMLDFRKAFYLINHRILINKLDATGIPPHLLRWLAAFLCDRHQQVKIGNQLLYSGSPNGGVPLSGPKCFIMYINDLVAFIQIRG